VATIFIIKLEKALERCQLKRPGTAALPALVHEHWRCFSR
jgi:hypothetical protein